jgi:hypothetical protein
MSITRRDVFKLSLMAGIGSACERFSLAEKLARLQVRAKGNPLFPGLGVCDPEAKVYGDQVYLYATHDASLKSTGFVMHNWWVWRTSDLVNWEMVSILKPQQTYLHKPSNECWGTDGASRDGRFYFYFSVGRQNIGVVEGSSPAGPWHDPLGHPLIAKGSVDTEARDPCIFQERDGTSYIIFGTFRYYIARLNKDMVSLAEPPRLIQVNHPAGPYGKGKTDDKPFVHRRGNQYYLSWGCYYAMSDSLFGPYDYKGSIIQADYVAPEFRNVEEWAGPKMISPKFGPKNWLTYDRHGTFFTLFGQNYFICNDQSQPGTSPYFRDSVISYVRYGKNGEIAPVRITGIGVGQYDAQLEIDAADYFKIAGAVVEEMPDRTFAVRVVANDAQLHYPKVRNLQPDSRLEVRGHFIGRQEMTIEVHRGSATGMELGKLKVSVRSDAKPSLWTIPLRNIRNEEDICLVFRVDPGESAIINSLRFT